MSSTAFSETGTKQLVPILILALSSSWTTIFAEIQWLSTFTASIWKPISTGRHEISPEEFAELGSWSCAAAIPQQEHQIWHPLWRKCQCTTLSGRPWHIVSEDIVDWMEWYERLRETIAILREQLQATATAANHSPASSSNSSTTTSTPILPAPPLGHPLHSSWLVNTGLPISQVRERQQRCKMSVLKKSVARALWFVDSFRLNIVYCYVWQSYWQHFFNDWILRIPKSKLFSPPSQLTHEALYQTLYLLDSFSVWWILQWPFNGSSFLSCQVRVW